MSAGSKDEVLARIRTALGRDAGTPSPVPAAVPRDYRATGEHAPGAPALLDLLIDRLEDYKATVHRCARGDLAATVARALADRGVRTVVAPSGVPDGWLSGLPGDVRVVRDEAASPLDVATLDGADGVLTGCTVAVAQTGTIVLDGSPACGRRAVTLVPDDHLVVVSAEQVVGTVPEALPLLDPRRPLTWVSGPSATSDIELSRVEGVHGPRTLVVVLVDAGS